MVIFHSYVSLPEIQRVMAQRADGKMMGIWWESDRNKVENHGQMMGE
jgi:hypothetical protein